MYPKFLYLTLLTLCAFANGPYNAIASSNAPPALTHTNIRFLAIERTTTTTTRAATTTSTQIVCSEICPAIFLPVCGSDLKTYSNECELDIADCNRRKAGRKGVTVLHTGACFKDTTTTTTTAAVISTHATRPHTTTTAPTTTATNTCGHSPSDCYPLGPFQTRFFDLSCALTPPYAGGLGCDAGGIKCCRFCGFDVYLPCPGTTTTSSSTPAPTETTSTTTAMGTQTPTETTTAAPSTTATTAVCPAGCVSWFDGCNTCICSETGGVGGCTRMFCEVTQTPMCLEFRSTTPAPTTTVEATTTTELSITSTPTPTTTAATTIPVTEVCPPGCVSWFDGCNTCTCGEVMACTLKFCFETQPPKCLSFESTSAPASTSVPTTTTTQLPSPSVPPTTLAPPTTVPATTAAVTTTTAGVIQTGSSTTPFPVCPESCLIWFNGCVSCPCVATGVLGQCAAVLCRPEQTQPATCMEFETTTITSPPTTPMPTSEAATTGSEEQPSPGPSETPTDGSGCCYEIGFGAFMVPVFGPATDVQSETECPEEERLGGATRFQPGMTCAEFYASVGAELPTTTETPMTEAPTTTPSPTTEPETTPSPPVTVCPQGCVVWYDGCNTCVCDGAGQLGTCTQHLCVWHAPEECITFQNQTLTQTETTTPIPTTISSAEIPDPGPGCCYSEFEFGPSMTQFVGPASDVQSETDCPVSGTIKFEPNMTCAEFYASIGAKLPTTPLISTTPTNPTEPST